MGIILSKIPQKQTYLFLKMALSQGAALMEKAIGHDNNATTEQDITNPGGFGRVAVLVEVDGLLAIIGVLCYPLVDVCGEEALCPDAVGGDVALNELVDEVAGVLLLSVAVEGHGDLGGGSLELRGVVAVAGDGFHEGDV